MFVGGGGGWRWCAYFLNIYCLLVGFWICLGFCLFFVVGGGVVD